MRDESTDGILASVCSIALCVERGVAESNNRYTVPYTDAELYLSSRCERFVRFPFFVLLKETRPARPADRSS
jgi:hypothetical protein